MEKKQWSNLKTGDKVTHKTWKTENGKPIDVIFIGEVIRFNSNWSQVLIKFESGTEQWYGRLGIELLTK